MNNVIENGEIVPKMQIRCCETCCGMTCREPKDITGYIFQECMNFDDLRLAIMKVEQNKMPVLRKPQLIRLLSVIQR